MCKMAWEMAHDLTSSVRGGKNSKEKKGLPVAATSLILSASFMAASEGDAQIVIQLSDWFVVQPLANLFRTALAARESTQRFENMRLKS